MREAVNLVLPLNVPLVYVLNKIDARRPLCFTPYVVSARMIFNQDVIDITDICARNLLSHTNAIGQCVMVFDHEFSKVLEKIWIELMETDISFRKLKKFFIALEIMEYVHKTHHIISCRVTHAPIFQIFSKTSDLTFSDNQISDDNLLSSESLDLLLKESPLFYLYFSSVNLIPFKMRNCTMLLRYGIRRQAPLLEVKINFEERHEDRVGCVVAAWKYDIPNEIVPVFDKPSISIVLDASCFFLKISELLELVASRILTRLSDADMIKFIRFNKINREVITTADKVVDLQSYVFLLTDWEKCKSSGVPLALNVCPH